GKIIPVPNAPGFELARERVERSLTERRGRRGDDPVRALFLGRLDRQKGLDRLTTVLRATNARKINVDWRIVGKAVVAQGMPPLTAEVLERLEPPATSYTELTMLYDW